jgi:hypothetical protein
MPALAARASSLAVAFDSICTLAMVITSPESVECSQRTTKFAPQRGLRATLLGNFGSRLTKSYPPAVGHLERPAIAFSRWGAVSFLSVFVSRR